MSEKDRQIDATKRKIEVMQAFVNGKKIQLSNRSNAPDWKTTDGEPLWNWIAFDYRVKPEPRVFWVNEYADNFFSIPYLTEKEANNHGDISKRVRCIKVVEVLDDDRK